MSSTRNPDDLVADTSAITVNNTIPTATRRVKCAFGPKLVMETNYGNTSNYLVC